MKKIKFFDFFYLTFLFIWFFISFRFVFTFGRLLIIQSNIFFFQSLRETRLSLWPSFDVLNLNRKDDPNVYWKSFLTFGSSFRFKILFLSWNFKKMFYIYIKSIFIKTFNGFLKSFRSNVYFFWSRSKVKTNISNQAIARMGRPDSKLRTTVVVDFEDLSIPNVFSCPMKVFPPKLK